MATNAFGGKQTDFREISSGTQPLPYQVHRCNECGYAGPEGAFTTDEPFSPLIAEQVRRELTPAAGAMPATASEKYEAAARIVEWQSATPRQVGELLLRAAWCAADEHDGEAERYFRLRAARTFERGLASYDAVPREERAVLTYLVGELWRRAGDSKQATAWFNRVPDEIVSPVDQRWIAQLAAQQRDRAREWLA